MNIDKLCEGRHFDREVIVLCVRWYLRYKLSLRDLVEIMSRTGPFTGAHDDHAVGQAVHAGVRQALESLCYDNRPVVAR